MHKFKSLVSRKSSSNDIPTTSTTHNGDTNGAGDSPEADVARGCRLFCESGGPNNTGDEFLHLPTIVDAAESSPAAAKEAANVIRKFLSSKNFMRAYVQYNAIMLLRILADNPGPTFTRNLDAKFVATVKELLRDGREMSVQQLLRETLDTFELQRASDETLALLITMWKNEKAKWQKKTGNDISSAVMQQQRSSSMPPGQQPFFPPPQSHSHRHQRHPSYGRLPPAHELASRIEEARTSSKLLTQVVQSTPPNEILSNDLIREFAERCREASRSIQGYINADNPAPDEDTLLTLIETNDGIAAALSKHQRALLSARKAASGSPAPVNGSSAPPNTQDTTPSVVHQIPKSGPAPILNLPRLPERPESENPFDDSHGTGVTPDDRARGTENMDTNATRSSAALPRRDRDVSDDEDSPARPRQYRF